ncbi:unnamed protein product [Bursaphelenchus xylophilus]|uniref:Translocation protein SEC62 n=1 Tax=Bursaphelenchus xylophilus TaxID=6326 RepID=A0A1I7SSI4_BURXY|nr:unnamed protein product [Bursaphelenchus xylophilus]CAG9097515.1 unnamed protein product [Bursaphelenchus xylophilus]
MTDRRNKKFRKDQLDSNKLSKEQEAWANFVRFNCPCKKSTFEGNEVEYFTGQKAIDTLVDSKKFGASSKEPKFSTREQAAAFLKVLLERGYFFRAKVLVPRPKPRPGANQDTKDSPRVRRLKEEKEKAEESARDNETANESSAEQKKNDERRKKKIKLIVHESQYLNDDSDVYVWIYDPTPLYKKVIGILIILGVIAGCLFPLWPDWTKLSVYYISMAGIIFFAVILGIGIARTILFGVIYAVTMGKHRFWFLPNLLADVGFFESFQPVYTYEYVDSVNQKDVKKEKKKAKSSGDVETKKDKPKKDKERKEEKKVEEEEQTLINDRENEEAEKYSNPSSEESDDKAEEDNETGSSSAVDASPNPAKKDLRKRRNVRKADEDDFVLVDGE